MAGMIALGVGLPIIFVSRYVSLGSIVATATAVPATAILATLGPSVPLGVPSLVLLLYPSIGALLVIFKHRENISRLLKGQERKLGVSVRVEHPPLETQS
jgi:glycerol-3-phosphate acyltransferase PlsY